MPAPMMRTGAEAEGGGAMAGVERRERGWGKGGMAEREGELRVTHGLFEEIYAGNG